MMMTMALIMMGMMMMGIMMMGMMIMGMMVMEMMMARVYCNVSPEQLDDSVIELSTKLLSSNLGQ